MIKPTMEHLNDPYVIQLVEALAKQDDKIERLRATLAHIRQIIEKPQTLSGSDEPSVIAQNRMLRIYELCGAALSAMEKE